MIKHIDNIRDEDVPEVAVPSAIPYVYSFHYHYASQNTQNPHAQAHDKDESVRKERIRVTKCDSSSSTCSSTTATTTAAASATDNKTDWPRPRPSGTFLTSAGLFEVSQEKALAYVQKMSNKDSSDNGGGGGSGVSRLNGTMTSVETTCREEGENAWLTIEQIVS